MTRKVLAISLLSVGAACTAPGPSVPDNLRPGADDSPIASLAARGVQIYECRAKAGDAQASEWAFVAPQAELFDAQGRPAGKHYAGPHWESDDGSKVAGTLKARADSPRPGAIPHLLLSVKADAKPGVLAGITSVQRLNTLGGATPATPCAAQDAGKQARVYYSADYRFLSK